MAVFAVVFLVGAALLGIGLVNRFAAGLLGRIEQLIWGLVLGWTSATGLSYLLALTMGRLAVVPQACLAGTVFVAGGISVWPIWRRRVTWRPFVWDDVPALGLLSVYFVPVSLYLWTTRMFFPERDGLYSGGAAWADMCLHLGISNAFLQAGNFPPVYTIFPPEPLRYPYLPDYLTALLMSWGLEAWQALTATAVPMLLAALGVFYYLAKRITRSRAAAMLAVILFMFNGGLGFYYFCLDLVANRDHLWDFWLHVDKNYARLWDQNIHWSNVLVDTLLPQRASIFGFALGFIVLTVFAIAWRRWEEDGADAPWANWRLLGAAGFVTALLPLYHSFTYMTVGIVSGFLFLLRPRRAWLAFWLPAVTLAMPQLAPVAGHVASSGFMYFSPWWMAKFSADSPLIYYLRNIGLPLIVIIPAMWQTNWPWRRFYLAFVGLLAVTMIVSVSPHEYNNLKLMNYWYAITSVFVAAWLVRLARVQRQRALAFALTIGCIFTALVTVHVEEGFHWQIFSRDDIAAADYVRNHTSPKALFLTGQNHNQVLATLAGRTILLGYTGWILSHGYSVTDRENDVKAMYRDESKSLDLIRRYHIDYIYLGSMETGTMHARKAFFDAHFPVLYQSGPITVYKVPKPGEIATRS